MGGEITDQDIQYMKIADKISELSMCNRKRTGAIIVGETGCFVTGYNHLPKGFSYSLCQNCPRENAGKVSGMWLPGEECPVIHAEVAAIQSAARNGRQCFGSTMYCTYKPCITCAIAIAEAGIKRVVYRDEYPGGEDVKNYLKQCSIELVHWDGEVGGNND